MGRWVDRAKHCAGIGKIVKSALLALLPVLALAGCVHKLTLEDIQEQCMKRGGMLMIIYTQEITASGPGEQIPSPGKCVMPENFAAPSTPSPQTPAPQQPAAQQPAAKSN
jgi:hypothetical protein